MREALQRMSIVSKKRAVLGAVIVVGVLLVSACAFVGRLTGEKEARAILPVKFDPDNPSRVALDIYEEK